MDQVGQLFQVGDWGRTCILGRATCHMAAQLLPQHRDSRIDDQRKDQPLQSKAPALTVLKSAAA